MVMLKTSAGAVAEAAPASAVILSDVLRCASGPSEDRSEWKPWL